MKLRSRTMALSAGTGAALLAGAAMVGFGQPQWDTGEMPTQDRDDEKKSIVGVYDAQVVFQQSEIMSELQSELAKIESEVADAQQAGDQQRMMSLQQRSQQVQQKQVNAFLEAVESKLPDVAEEAGVQVVAQQFAYVHESFGEPQDLTEKLVNEID